MCVVTPTDFFTTILHPSLKELNIESDDMVQRGWQPVGGPFITPSGKFAQAFYKKYEEPAPTKKGSKSK